MTNTVKDYFCELSERFGNGWNRFWYTPSDPLGVGLLRLLTGLVALYTVAAYGPDLVWYFGPDGLLPVETVRVFFGDTTEDGVFNLARFSYFNYMTDPAQLRTAHFAGLVVLALFTAGVFTRLTSVLALIVVLSYFHRGPMLTAQLESVLAIVMAYLCLAPAGACLSVDRLIARRRKPGGAEALISRPSGPQRSTAATVATRLIQLHVCLVLLMMGISKLDGSAWWTGQATWFLIARFETCPFDLAWLHDYPELLDAFTHAIVLFEIAFPLLVWNRWARPLLLGIAPVMLGLVAVLTGLFAYAVMMLIALTAFVPGEVFRGWFDAAASRLSRAKGSNQTEGEVAKLTT